MTDERIPEGANPIPNEESKATGQDALETENIAAEDTAVGGEAAPEITADPTLMHTPAPKKRKLGLVLGGVAAVAVVVVAAILFTTVFASPQKAVLKALKATQEQQLAVSQQLVKDFSIIRLLSTSTADRTPTKTTFDLGFKSINTGSTNDALLNGMLAGAGIKNTIHTDPTNKAASLDGAVYYTGLNLVDYYLYFSPELLAGNMPGFSDTVLSLNPKTYATDAKGSAFADVLALDDASLLQTQALLDSQAEALAMPALDQVQFATDMYGILAKAVTNATYEKGGKINGLKLYTIKMPGDDLHATLLEFYRYLYLDGPMSASMRGILAPALPAGVEYEAFINTQVLQMLETNAAFEDATLSLAVNKKGALASASLDTSMVIEGSSYKLNYLLEASDMNSMAVTMTMTAADAAPALDISMQLTTAYTEDVYAMDMMLRIDMDTNAADPDTHVITMETASNLKLSKDGQTVFDLGVTGTEDGAPLMALKFDMQGSVTEQDGVYTLDFPTLSAGMDMNGEAMSIQLTAKSTVEKIDSVTPPLSPVSVFSLNEEQISQEFSLYSNGIYGLLMGAITSGL